MCPEHKDLSSVTGAIIKATLSAYIQTEPNRKRGKLLWYLPESSGYTMPFGSRVLPYSVFRLLLKWDFL